MSHALQAPVLKNEALAPGYFHLVFHAPAIAREAQPGQFVEVRCGDARSWDPLLRRPFSVFWCDPAGGEVAVLFRAAGRGTAWLSERPSGWLLDVLGPLGGRGFGWDGDLAQPLLVGGGVGIPPLYFLAQRLAARGVRPRALLGFATAQQVLWVEPFREVCREVTVTTLDGSAGRAGLVTDPLPDLVRRHAVDQIFACGPHGMLAAVARIAREAGIPSQLSLEERMACGVGACLSCVCPVRTAEGGTAFQRVCLEGPVFPGEVVVFE